MLRGGGGFGGELKDVKGGVVLGVSYKILGSLRDFGLDE